MEMDEDKEVSIIPRRPFLRMVGVIADMREGMLTVRVGMNGFSLDLTRPSNVLTRLKVAS
jgi:hypothetical protein